MKNRVDNLGSAKVIEYNDRVYENNYYDESMKKSYKRYWIDVNQVLLKESKKRILN